MSAMTDHFEDDAPEQAPRVNWQDAREEDAYWSGAFWQERYYRWDCDYEDYAPAYCVGYAGCAQYGGAFAQAERSLCANWERIKGDSRLSLDDALPAMRAAWDHMASRREGRARPAVAEAGFAPALVGTAAERECAVA
jgi:hypothetical protein